MLFGLIAINLRRIINKNYLSIIIYLFILFKYKPIISLKPKIANPFY